MARIASIIGISFASAWLWGQLGRAYYREFPDSQIPFLVLACTGGIIGAIAAGAREIAIAFEKKTEQETASS